MCQVHVAITISIQSYTHQDNQALCITQAEALLGDLGFPNTYTFTKFLTEHMVAAHSLSHGGALPHCHSAAIHRGLRV